jgi:hypothetical protein
MGASVPPDDQSPQGLYLDLIKKCLTRDLFGKAYQPLAPGNRVIARALSVLRRKFLMPGSLRLVLHAALHPTRRAEWGVWPHLDKDAALSLASA